MKSKSGYMSTARKCDEGKLFWAALCQEVLVSYMYPAPLFHNYLMRTITILIGFSSSSLHFVLVFHRYVWSWKKLLSMSVVKPWPISDRKVPEKRQILSRRNRNTFSLV